jgi:hypothetical protein
MARHVDLCSRTCCPNSLSIAEEPSGLRVSGTGVRVAPVAIGDRLLALRTSRGLGVRALARHIERHHSIVSRWEHGRLEPTLVDLWRLSRSLQVDVDDLLADATGSGRRWSSRSHSQRERRAIGGALRRARELAGLLLGSAIAASGIGGRRLLRIEAGADPSLEELQRLTAMAGVTAGSIVRRSRGIRTRLPAAGSQRAPRRTRRRCTLGRSGRGRRACTLPNRGCREACQRLATAWPRTRGHPSRGCAWLGQSDGPGGYRGHDHLTSAALPVPCVIASNLPTTSSY